MNRDDLVSPAYRAILKAAHEQKPGWGKYGKDSAVIVAKFASRIGAATILDFGCGTGTLARALPGCDVREYDPGIPGKDGVPVAADLVVATDVMEHIEPDRLDATLRFIRQLARKGAFLIIATSLSRETLPDGRNAHLIVKAVPWWRNRMIQHGFLIDREEIRKGLYLWCR